MPSLDTFCDNGAQIPTTDTDKKYCSTLAVVEFNHTAKTLEDSGVKVYLFDDNSHTSPDPVFLNNWFSTHPDDTVAIYPIYHTNMFMFMSITSHFVLHNLDMLHDAEQQQNIMVSLQKSGRTSIDLTPAQVYQFAGSYIELTDTNGKILALAQSAYHSLAAEQISTLEKNTVLLPSDVNTIELGDGSVRYMIATIHLKS
jgi:hypothetical protein